MSGTKLDNNQLTQHLPTFSDVKIDQVEKNISSIITQNCHEIDSLLKQNQFTWDNLIYPLECLNDKLHNAWSPINHMNAVVNSNKLRQVYNQCVPKLTEYSTALGQNTHLYQAICAIAKSKEFTKLDFAQKKVIENEIRDFKLAGVGLAEQEKKQFTDISKQLAELTTKFEENVLDATQGWQKHTTSAEEVQGIPKHALHAAAELAKHNQKAGWIFTLEAPSFIAVITYADSAKLRKEMYWAYITRASNEGPNAGKWDNSQVMQAILQKRLNLVRFLEFNNYAEYSLATKMVKKPEKVLSFLQQLIALSLPKAKQEFAELCQFAKENFNVEYLEAWDIAYYSEKLRQHRYAISQEELRPYFPEYKVVAGLFAIVEKLFQVRCQEIHDFDSWHPDVRCFALYDKTGKLCSAFYFDLYARENKRGGAWMDDCRVRRRLANGRLQIPVAYVTCNFNAPIGDEPALFTHEEVITLFHEFGHSLQHMLTKIDYTDVSGINGVPWDAVEVASQFLENWAWEKESLAFISEHYQSKQSLPNEMFAKMHRAKNFQAAMMMMRQLEFALFDFRLHMEFDPNYPNQIQHILDEVRTAVSVVPTAKFNRFQHAFSHIFAGGYAAGYYSYKWAEVMAADAFALFKENGIFDQATSEKFLTTFLQSGGAISPEKLFINFRGRKPQIEALLKQSGIID